MSELSLEALSLKELKSLQKDLVKAIAGAEVRSRSEAHAKLEAFARDMGFTLSDFVGVEGAKTTRAPAKAKYRHPENPTLTWSGRGRKPLWFADHINAGKDPSDLAV